MSSDGGTNGTDGGPAEPEPVADDYPSSSFSASLDDHVPSPPPPPPANTPPDPSGAPPTRRQSTRQQMQTPRREEDDPTATASAPSPDLRSPRTTSSRAERLRQARRTVGSRSSSSAAASADACGNNNKPAFADDDGQQQGNVNDRDLHPFRGAPSSSGEKEGGTGSSSPAPTPAPPPSTSASSSAPRRRQRRQQPPRGGDGPSPSSSSASALDTRTGGVRRGSTGDRSGSGRRGASSPSPGPPPRRSRAPSPAGSSASGRSGGGRRGSGGSGGGGAGGCSGGGNGGGSSSAKKSSSSATPDGSRRRRRRSSSSTGGSRRRSSTGSVIGDGGGGGTRGGGIGRSQSPSPSVRSSSDGGGSGGRRRRRPSRASSPSPSPVERRASSPSPVGRRRRRSTSTGSGRGSSSPSPMDRGGEPRGVVLVGDGDDDYYSQGEDDGRGEDVGDDGGGTNTGTLFHVAAPEEETSSGVVAAVGYEDEDYRPIFRENDHPHGASSSSDKMLQQQRYHHPAVGCGDVFDDRTNVQVRNDEHHHQQQHQQLSASSDVPPGNHAEMDTVPQPPQPQPQRPLGSSPKSGGANLEPYICKLARFELFSTHQAYYLVGCDKHNAQYRVLRIDRTRIEASSSSSKSSGDDASATPASTAPNPAPAPGVGANPEKGVGSSTGANSEPSGPSSPDGADAAALADGDSSVVSSTAGGNPADVGRPGATPHGNNRPAGPPPPPRTPSTISSASINPPRHTTTTTTTTTTTNPLRHFVSEDAHVYTQTEIQTLLDMVHDGNLSRGGLCPLTKAYGVVGFIRFLDCYYLTLITKRVKVGSVGGGNAVYSIKSTETFPLKPAARYSHATAGPNNLGGGGGASSAHPGGYHADGGPGGGNNGGGGNDPSSMLLSMWNRGKRAAGLGLTQSEIDELRYQSLYKVIDLTKNFYFSYTYDITRSLQENFLATTSQPFPPPPCKAMYAWNWFQTRELEDFASWYWILPVVHGAFVQRKLNDYGRSLNLILLARRSRHFAGTRYLKRGVSDRGKVANDVEHEQILHDEGAGGGQGVGIFSSYLQMRGSIPTYWTQESSMTMPKPPIVLNRVDPTYNATQQHFEDLFKRYGSPMVVLDLVKQSEKREREVIVGNEYRHAIDYLNTYIDPQHKIRYCALDYSHISKHRNLNISASLNEVATWAVNQTGFFCSAPRWKIVGDGRVEPFEEADCREAQFLSENLGVPIFSMEQKGVLRTNCIDCLDRTNVAQFSAGVMALAQQLVVMGIRSSIRLDPSSNIVRVLIDMYVEIGDQIALQYGGSEAHKKGPTSGSGSGSNVQALGKHKELLTSIRRYYSNAFTDRLKQDAMNLFLGYYVPLRHKVPLWEMESDYYLHNFHVRAGGGALQSMKAHQRAFGFEWSNSDDAEEDQAKDDQPSDARVRNRCTAQAKSLSVWWKVAVQSYIQQRMWMHLGRSPTEAAAILPPRFERIYQPEKLAQFDKFFSQSWATPIRLSHSAQHSHATEDAAEMRSSHYKNFSSKHPSKSRDKHNARVARVASRRGNAGGSDVVAYDTDSTDDLSSDSEESFHTINDFVNQHGFRSKLKPSLTHFLDAAQWNSTTSFLGNSSLQSDEKSRKSDAKTGARRSQRQKARKEKGLTDACTAAVKYIGDTQPDTTPCEEYIQYANHSQDPHSFLQQPRPVAQREFTKCLYETNLDSSDVDGILRLAKSAHIGSVIGSGEYRGLSQDASAIQVTTAIHEQFNAMIPLEERQGGDIRRRAMGSFDESALQKNGYDKSGVKESIINGCERFARAEKTYSEILDTGSLGCRRSDLTGEDSMRLYCSMFDENVTLSKVEMEYMLGKKLGSSSAASSSAKKGSHKLIAKQKERGGSTHSRERGVGTAASVHGSLLLPAAMHLPAETYGHVTPGFEQINEDLYARKDNKFLVLNGAGIDCWNATHPITKMGGMKEDFLIT